MNIPNTFSNFNTAVKSEVNFDGIGTWASMNLALINLDHYAENGMINPQVQKVFDHFPNTYVEINPSGTDIHIPN